VATEKALIGRIEKIHRTFNVRALKRLYPALAGNELIRATARESMRDHAYLQNMRSRLTQGVELVEQDPTLSSEERERRLATLESNERRYLRQHVEQASWRLSAEADMSRLKEQGEPGAVWELNPGLREHTADCWAMAGKFWGWDVLDRINPANRHPGCGCKLKSRSSALAAGMPVVEGVRSPALQALMQEADVIEVPVRPGSRGGNPFHDAKSGQFAHGPSVGVAGVPGAGIAKEVRPALDRLLATIKDGDVGKINNAYTAAQKATRRLRGPKDRREHLRMLSRVHAAAINPEGKRLPMGAKVKLAGTEERQPVPHPVHSAADEANTGPWGEKGNFAWFVPSGTLGSADDQSRLLQILRRTGGFDITETHQGAMIETSPELDRVTALGEARALEAKAAELRNRRMVGPRDALPSNAPLDLHPSELEEGLRRELQRSPVRQSRYPLVSYDQLGKAAEALAPEAQHRMEELGLIPPNSETRMPGLQQSGRGAEEDPIDWEIGDYAIEVKAESMRGADIGLTREGGFSVSSGRKGKGEELKQRARKVAAAERRGMKPGLVYVLTDLDNDVGHIVFHPYADEPTEKTYGAVRPPKELRERLFGGEARPGDQVIPGSGANANNPEVQWVYLGSFRLPYNPLRPSSIPEGRRVSPGRRLAAGDLNTLSRRRDPSRAPADIGLGSRTAPVRTRELVPGVRQDAAERSAHNAAELEDRNSRIEMMFKPKEEGGKELGQSEIARQIGLSQPSVRKILVKRLGEDYVKRTSGGAGARRDIPNRGARRVADGSKRDEVVRLFNEEKMHPREIASELKTHRRYINRVVSEEGLLDAALIEILRARVGVQDPPTLEEVAHEYGTSVSHLRDLASREGVAESEGSPPSLPASHMEPVG
jgi:hypothetical protein